MARDNVSWGEERIANELRLKLGVQVSPRTVGKYMPKRPPGQPRGDQRWLTFLRNHAEAIVACDFLTVVTATFHLLHIVRVWRLYYNTMRPHMSLGPGIPNPPDVPPVLQSTHRHKLPQRQVVSAHPILGGLHHDYGLVAAPA